MISEKHVPSTKKRIRQVKIRFNKDYPPYWHLNPYQLLNQLNIAVKARYDIQFVHIRYIMTKNKWQRELNDIYYGDINFEIDRQTNNVFSVQDSPEANPLEKNQTSISQMISESLNTAQEAEGIAVQNKKIEEMPHSKSIFLKEYIFNDAVKLVPPPDYNPEIDERKLQKQRQLEQEKVLRQIESAVREIMKIQNENHSEDINSIRSIGGFKIQGHRQEFQKNEYQIYAKGIMHEPVIEKLNEDKNSKKPIQIKVKNATLKLYLHPTDKEESLDLLTKNYRITDWSFNTLYRPEQETFFYQYFGMEQLQKKVNKINKSVKIINSISFNEKHNGSVDSFSIISFLWNEIIMKVNVKLAQIRKIQIAGTKILNQGTTEEKKITEYYFHLTYPVMYYINLMKKQQANAQEYIKQWERVQNFVLLDNKIIGQNYLLRYYLFNNTVLRINLVKEKVGNYNVDSTIDKIESLIKKFKGTIQTEFDVGLYTSKFSLKNLARDFDYNKFLKAFHKHPGLTIQEYDKIWKIKYLLLVMARYNYILPKQINEILNHISDAENMQSLDCYLYILWKTTTNMWGYSNQGKRFYHYMLEQFDNIKKMDLKNITKRMMKDTDIIIYIFRVSLTPSGYMFNPPTPQMKGRLMKQFSKESDFFLRVSLNQQNQIQLRNQKYITKMMFRKQMDKIKILDREYIPLGWSPSQLRSFSLWYFHEIEERPKANIEKLNRQYILSFLGNFDKIQNPAKKAARIGQSFSASWTYNATQIQCKEIPDEYSSQRYLFTDGIGKISATVLEKISLRLSIRQLSVIQMRYKGAKGVLALDPSLPNNVIELRPSMIKFTCDNINTNKYLDILDWNKYKAGFLNRQIIILLRTLGIQNSVFTELQKQHIKTLSSLTFKDCSIFKHLNDDLNTEINNLQPANQTILDLLKAGFVLEKEPFFRGVLETLKKNGYHQLKIKSNILVKQSARIIGIIDQYQILEENEIYCSVHDPYALEPVRKVVDGPAIITRNPCLHPADIRVVNCVGANQIKARFQRIGIDQNRFEKFVNTVIFPMKGKYPLTAQISGSDLDGDNFFVCWDPRLIPKKIFPINLIDEADKPKGDKKEEPKVRSIQQTYSDMLDFFIDYTNYQKLGQIDNSHLIHADRDLVEYASNKNCMKLAEIHGKAVDFPKTGNCPPFSSDLFVSEYPDFMEKQNYNTYMSKSIMGILYREIKQKIQNLLEDVDVLRQIDSDLIHNYSFDQTLEDVVQCLNMIRKYERDLENLIHLINVDSEYQIYSGNFSTVKDQVKAFGKNRLISSILSLREKFFEKFFRNMDDQKMKYANCLKEEHIQKTNFFSNQVYKKAQLIYLITYIYKFSDLKLPDQISEENSESRITSISNQMQKLKEQIQNGLHKLGIHNKEGKFCGFIWFIIPKVIINLKITSKRSKSNMQNLDDLQDRKEEQGQNDHEDEEL